MPPVKTFTHKKNGCVKKKNYKIPCNLLQNGALFDNQHDSLYSVKYKNDNVDLLPEFSAIDTSNCGEVSYESLMEVPDESLYFARKRKCDFDEELSISDTRRATSGRHIFTIVAALSTIFEKERNKTKIAFDHNKQERKKPKITLDIRSLVVPRLCTCQYCHTQFCTKIAWHRHEVMHKRKLLHIEYHNGEPKTHEAFVDGR